MSQHESTSSPSQPRATSPVRVTKQKQFFELYNLCRKVSVALRYYDFGLTVDSYNNTIADNRQSMIILPSVARRILEIIWSLSKKLDVPLSFNIPLHPPLFLLLMEGRGTSNFFERPTMSSEIRRATDDRMIIEHRLAIADSSK